MKKLTTLVIALVALAALGTACKYPGFKKDKEGFYYKFYKVNKKEAQPQIGDIVEMTYTLRVTDSVLVDEVPLTDMIIESIYPGDIYAAIRKMHLYDSATFIMNGDTFFHYFMGRPFEFDKKELFFDLKLNKIISGEEYEQQQLERQQEYEAMIEEYRLSEDSLIANYIKSNNVKVKPTASGLYLMKNGNGMGKAIKNGSKVSVHYTGKLLDGSVFDSSVDRGEPISLVVGDGMVIPGWEEALLLLKGGDKATVLIPSKLAYGSRGSRNVIPPYSPLIFDIEVVSVE